MVPEPSAAGGKITVTVFSDRRNECTDDLSGAGCVVETDIPLHAQAMLKTPVKALSRLCVVGPIKQIEVLQKKRLPAGLRGDVVGTGSRKSATNSVLFMGDDHPERAE